MPRPAASSTGMTVSASRAATVEDLAAAQAGLLDRHQLRAAGFGPDGVRNHVAAGRWQSHGRRAVAVSRGPLSAEQLRWWVVLDGGAGTALTGLTALHDYGLEGFPTDVVHAVTRHGRRTASGPGFARHVTRRPLDLHPARRPATLRLEAAAVDAVRRLATPRLRCALLAALVQQRLTTAERLRAALLPASRLPSRRLVLLVLDDIAGGAGSLAEIDFSRLARRAGLPSPLRQSVRLDAAGRRRYLDADFGGFAVEVDGAVHLRPSTWWSDQARQNELVLTGSRLLRFPSVAVRLDEPAVARQLRLAAACWGTRPVADR